MWPTIGLMVTIAEEETIAVDGGDVSRDHASARTSRLLLGVDSGRFVEISAELKVVMSKNESGSEKKKENT